MDIATSGNMPGLNSRDLGNTEDLPGLNCSVPERLRICPGGSTDFLGMLLGLHDWIPKNLRILAAFAAILFV